MSFDNVFNAYEMKLQKNFYEAVLELHEEMVVRIFTDNKDINGNKPKPYDTDPMYASVARYKGLVRLGGKITKSGKSKYFEGGYSQLKSESGRPPIELTGRLVTAFENGLREVNPFEYEIKVPKEDGDKIRGHFVNFFKVSQTEKENLLKRIVSDSEGN
ncbi:MAG: hypothetical protein ACK459_15205 [Akkermansiaceae bacterium]|jgi:hypothetical protein